MKEITLIVQQGCPYCKEAEKFFIQMQKEFPKVRVHRIESGAEESETFDYYYLPAVFLGTKRMFHGACTLEDVRRVFEEAGQDKAQ